MVDMAFPYNFCLRILRNGCVVHWEFRQLPYMEIDRAQWIPHIPSRHQPVDHRLSGCSNGVWNLADGHIALVWATVNSCVGTMDGSWITDRCMDLDGIDPNPDTDRIEQHRPVYSGNRQTALHQFLVPQDSIHDKCGAVCLDDVAFIKNKLFGINRARLIVCTFIFHNLTLFPLFGIL